MKLPGVSILLLVLLVLLILQSIGGVLQIQDYRKAVRRMHQLGNVGMGQKRGKLLDGHVAIIACDSEGIITGAEVMDGIGVLSRFHKKETLMGEPLVGNSIYTFLDMAAGLDKKEWKRLQGYFRAFEALEVRFNDDMELTREQEAYMETKRGKKGKKLR
ncbi:MAG: transcriptional regulator [Oscillospiraceae bacterium]|nr:transcriptional regulator [Oscillospiraceae bacterium]